MQVTHVKMSLALNSQRVDRDKKTDPVTLMEAACNKFLIFSKMYCINCNNYSMHLCHYMRDRIYPFDFVLMYN